MEKLNHTCDCGRQYADLNGLEACQISNHGQKNPCPNCDINRRKLQAAEEMARSLGQCWIVLAQVLNGIVTYGEIDRAFEQARIARLAWEKAEKATP